METDSSELDICPNCGSTGYVENYPTAGKRMCFKCGHESVKIKLKVVETEREILESCPFCGKKGEEDDTIFDNNDIIVLRCKKCGKLDGYRFFDFNADELEIDDYMYDSLSVKIAEQEGRKGKRIMLPIKVSRVKEIKKVLRKRERSPVEECKKQLDLLVNKKAREMNAAGISYETIRGAKSKAQSFIENKGSVTKKQLESLFPAALHLVQKSGKTLGNKVTERQLERIFGVTRKTIRKWKKSYNNFSITS